MAKEPNSVDGTILSDEELEGVSGGEIRIPSTHAEIDAAWDAIQATANTGDLDAAATMAYNMGLIPFALNRNNENYFVSEKPFLICVAGCTMRWTGSRRKSMGFAW